MAVNPNSPDTIKMTRKIREHILKTGGGETAGDFKAYEGMMTRGPVLRKFAMMPIPAASFLMGSPVTEAKRKADEGPQIRVQMNGFWMGATEVT